LYTNDESAPKRTHLVPETVKGLNSSATLTQVAFDFASATSNVSSSSWPATSSTSGVPEPPPHATKAAAAATVRENLRERPFAT